MSLQIDELQLASDANAQLYVREIRRTVTGVPSSRAISLQWLPERACPSRRGYTGCCQAFGGAARCGPACRCPTSLASSAYRFWRRRRDPTRGRASTRSRTASALRRDVPVNTVASGGLVRTVAPIGRRDLRRITTGGQHVTSAAKPTARRGGGARPPGIDPRPTLSGVGRIHRQAPAAPPGVVGVIRMAPAREYAAVSAVARVSWAPVRRLGQAHRRSACSRIVAMAPPAVCATRLVRRRRPVHRNRQLGRAGDAAQPARRRQTCRDLFGVASACVRCRGVRDATGATGRRSPRQCRAGTASGGGTWATGPEITRLRR